MFVSNVWGQGINDLVLPFFSVFLSPHLGMHVSYFLHFYSVGSSFVADI